MYENKKRRFNQLRRKNDYYKEDNNEHKVRRLSGEIHKNKKMIYQAWTISVDRAQWRWKKLVQEYNSIVKHGDNYKEVKFPEGVTIICGRTRGGNTP